MQTTQNHAEPRFLPISESAMAHLYRGELGRSDRWRTRLDTTSNWALTTTAAVISFAFSSPGAPAVTVLVGLWMVLTFLVIEARRYRYYDLWNRRVRLLEEGFWAPILRREPVDPEALRELAYEIERPQLQLSFFSAMQTRLSRAYGSLLVVLFLSWFVKIYIHPSPLSDVGDWTAQWGERAHVGPISGWIVTALIAGLAVYFLLLAIIARFVRQPLGELRNRPRPQQRSIWEAFYRPYSSPPARERPGSRESRTGSRPTHRAS